MSESVKAYLAIPQEVLNLYNARYNNYTYRLFEAKLLNLTAHSTVYGGHAFIHTVLNLLIDASLERSGATFYAEAEISLLQYIRPISTDLVALARQHLENFAPSTQPEMPQTDIERTIHEITYAQETLMPAMCEASGLHSWRGRVAYYWISAADYLLHAASAVLVDSHYDSYPLEKLDRAMTQLQYGVLEAQEHRFTLPVAFVVWMRQLVKARD